jgi:hypothetical protein
MREATEDRLDTAFAVRRNAFRDLHGCADKVRSRAARNRRFQKAPGSAGAHRQQGCVQLRATSDAYYGRLRQTHLTVQQCHFRVDAARARAQYRAQASKTTQLSGEIGRRSPSDR